MRVFITITFCNKDVSVRFSVKKWGMNIFQNESWRVSISCLNMIYEYRGD